MSQMGEKDEKKLPENPPKRKQDTDNGQPQMKGILSWALILSLMFFMTLIVMKNRDVYTDISFNPEFIKLVKSGKIEKCEIVKEISGVDYVRGTLLPGEKDPPGPRRKFKVYVQAGDVLEKLLNDGNVPFEYVPQSVYISQILINILPVLLIFGVLYFLFVRQMRSAGHGALSFGKSRAKLLSQDKHKITFENVAGIDEAKEEVQEIIEFLKDPKRFQKLGGRIPKGVLLMGPPGTGKTLLAKAIAGEADVPFFSISGSDFVEMFVGVGASRVRDMFEQGKKNAPCIMFIDEIDAVGRSRFSGIGGGHDEREQTLNALLVEMDGFETQEGVIIIAATNRPDVLDPALLRPGRFDRQIVIDLPTIDGREAILKMHAKGIKLGKAANLRRLARGTPGFSGADLANLLNESALLAAKQNKEAVDMKDLDEARDKVRWGRERRSHVLDEKEKKVTAYHEAGHALVMQLVEESEPLHKITIIPRGVAYLGATMQLPEKDRHMEGKVKLLGMLAGLMGGRVSEEIFFGDITSGASSDLREATRISRLMICDWGMSREMGPQTYGRSEDMMFLGREITRTQDYSEETAKRIDEEVNIMLRQSYDRARKIIETNRAKLEMIANLLLERETLDGRDVEEIVKHGRVLSDQERDEIDKAEEEKKKTAGGDKDAGKNGVVNGEAPVDPSKPSSVEPAHP